MDPAALASAPNALEGADPLTDLDADAAVDAEPSASAEIPVPHGPGHELANFYVALRGLEKHTRTEHVRVVWLGDSHGAADIWSGALRTALQKRFGNGGPGFVHVGLRGYRHDGIKHEVPGKWLTRPRGPSTSIATGDGVFGLGGVLMYSEEPSARASITISDQPAPLPPSLTWDLCYRLGSLKAEITVKLTGAKTTTLRASAAEPFGVLRHLVLTSSGAGATMTVTPADGFPELCGVVIEADPKAQPGVVLDTLGINGARLNTPLAWDEASWTSELARRAPALVILEYGTNEASDRFIKAEQYTSRLKRVMGRVRMAAPKADCLVLAPTDRADTLERMPLVRDALKEAAGVVGCGFWDTYAAMGGKGSILTWRSEQPPRAAPDGVHLTYRGYRELGDKLAAEVLSGYSP
jgi:lysophospholipase L1-like esterase